MPFEPVSFDMPIQHSTDGTKWLTTNHSLWKFHIYSTPSHWIQKRWSKSTVNLKICQKVSKIEFMKVNCNRLNQASSIRVDIWWLSYFHIFDIAPFVVESIKSVVIHSWNHFLILLLSCIVSRYWYPLFKNICCKITFICNNVWECK